MFGWVVAIVLYAIGALGVYQYQWRLVINDGSQCRAIVDARTKGMSDEDVRRMLTVMFVANAVWWPGYVLWIAGPWPARRKSE